MRNIDRIRSMSVEELAPLLLDHYSEEEIDYDWDEEPYISGINTYIKSPSGGEFDDFWDSSMKEAIEDCIQWLNKEY